MPKRSEPSARNTSPLSRSLRGLETGEARNRCAAGAFEFGQEGALGRKGRGSLGVRDRLERSKRARIGAARGDRNRALAGRRKELIEVEHGAGAIGEAEPPQPGEREQGRADRPALGLAQPCLDIAAQERRKRNTWA